jgi:glutaredoxin
MGVKEIEKKGVGEITLYTLPHCTYCQTLKGALDKLEVPYTDIDVELNMLMGDWLEEKFKNRILP